MAEWYSKHVRESQYCLQISKCEDPTCCKKTRSGLKSVLPNGFLPPPYRLQQSKNSFEVPKPTETSTSRFAPLLIALSLKLDLILQNFNIRPYDFHCPSVQSQLNDRVCKKCGLYFASKKLANSHAKQLHATKNQPMIRVRPVRVAARRANEIMCIIQNDQFTEDEDVEWLDEGEVDCAAIMPPTIDA